MFNIKYLADTALVKHKIKLLQQASEASAIKFKSLNVKKNH